MLSTLVRRLAGVLLLSALPVAAAAALPAGYRFSSVEDAIPVSALRTDYADQVLSIATAVNDSDQMFGFWLTPAGVFHTHAAKFGINPLGDVLDTGNFIGLTGNNITCVWFLCRHFAFGIRVVPPADPAGVATGITAFVNTPMDATVVPDSLPYTLNPGNFVDENAAGVVASTQVDAPGQYGVLLHAGGAVYLEDVPWLVAINDLAEPLVLGWNGSNGDCLVYGEGCPADVDDGSDDTCVDEHGHRHRGHGRGHESHGRGHGYGHDRCTCSSATPRSAARAPVPRDGFDGDDPPGTIVIDPDGPANASLLIRLLADGSTVRYAFPQTVTGTDDLANAFPLAINGSRAILRGDVRIGDTVLDKRLLSCAFNPAALDADADGVLDCIGGLLLVGGAGNSIRVGTVLGFTLNESHVLAGNLGYNAAGTGAPVLVDVAAATPAAESLANLADIGAGWEVSALTDMNNDGKLVGFGYRDCGSEPRAVFLEPLDTASVPALRFGRGAFEFPAHLLPGATLAITPTLYGGSGVRELRVQVKTPDDSHWTLLSDWSATTASWPSGSYQGDICFLIEARDVVAPAAVARTVVRYSVAPADGAGEEDGDTTVVDLRPDGRFRLLDLLGAPGGFMMLALAALALRRRVG